jgi:hypothetical protein
MMNSGIVKPRSEVIDTMGRANAETRAEPEGHFLPQFFGDNAEKGAILRRRYCSKSMLL